MVETLACVRESNTTHFLAKYSVSNFRLIFTYVYIYRYIYTYNVYIDIHTIYIQYIDIHT